MSRTNQHRLPWLSKNGQSWNLNHSGVNREARKRRNKAQKKARKQNRNR